MQPLAGQALPNLLRQEDLNHQPENRPSHHLHRQPAILNGLPGRVDIFLNP
jgi:hypothetical protein